MSLSPGTTREVVYSKRKQQLLQLMAGRVAMKRKIPLRWFLPHNGGKITCIRTIPEAKKALRLLGMVPRYCLTST
jgi:hypothetical protein